MKLLKFVEEYLKARNMDFAVLAEQSTIAFGFEGVSKTNWHCIFQTREEEEQVMFYSTFIENIKPKYIQNIIDYIIDENYRLVVGNFEIDRRDGEINYKTSLDCSDTELTYSLLDGIMFNNLSTMDRHIENIGLISKGKEPKYIETPEANIRVDNPNWKDSLGDLE